MNQNLNSALQAPTSPASTAPSPVARPLDPQALAQALAGIRSDSQRQSETYLQDTVVPHGGE